MGGMDELFLFFNQVLYACLMRDVFVVSEVCVHCVVVY